MTKKFWESKTFWGITICLLSFAFNWMEVFFDIEFFSLLTPSQYVKLIGSTITFVIGFCLALYGRWVAYKKLEI
jgi:hypothetical protein